VATATASFAPTATSTAPPSATRSPTAIPPTATEPPPTTTPTPTATEPVPPTATPTTIDPRSFLGGETTVFDVTRNAFGQPARNLPLDERTDFFVGNAFFNRNWVTAPSSNTGLDGLGPVFNSRSCSGCHFRDGRGRPPLDEGDDDPALLLRLSVPGTDERGAPLGDPTYGGQLGQNAILGVPPEGRRAISYREIPGEYGDGEAFSLREPTYAIGDPAFGPPDPELMISPRIAPALIGVGLLEAIPDETLLAWADPDDLDGDGISGRPNFVWDVRSATAVVGRFGWKANQSTVEQQNAGAFVGDIGLTTDLFPEEDCPAPQVECSEAPNGGSPEIDQQKVDFVTFYTSMLAVPARRDVGDPETDRGEILFSDLGCASCHVEVVTTGSDAPPSLAEQSIRPYTDLLLHDMGPGLADGRPDFEATGSEWRTPPLWGIGLVETVNRHTFFLHDGRARDLAEAILWHGGEAEESKEGFRLLPREDRIALIRFLESL
jgi:CxxC motif-containing protein (DUF1111 family)